MLLRSALKRGVKVTKKQSRKEKVKAAKNRRFLQEKREKFGSNNAKYQAKQLIKSHSRIGFSKLKDRESGIKGIHSYAAYNKTLGEVKRFTDYVKEKYKINRLNMIKREHAIDYLKFKEEQGLKYGSLKNIETSLRHLSDVMKRDENYRVLEVLMPDKRIYPTKAANVETERLERSYTVEQADRVIKLLEASKKQEEANAVYLARYTGLRADEVCKIEARHFVYDDKTDKYSICIEKNDLSRVTKGNRYRNIEIDSVHTKRIESMLNDKLPDERLINLDSEALSVAVLRVKRQENIALNIESMHGFRHTFARERFIQLSKGSEEQQDMINRIVDNLYEGRRANYGVKEEEKDIYNSTKHTMDCVHEELGHGQSRWYLAMRYLDMRN